LLLIHNFLQPLQLSLGTLQLVEPPAQLALEVDLGALRLRLEHLTLGTKLVDFHLLLFYLRLHGT